jgi:hypothetical protein
MLHSPRRIGGGRVVPELVELGVTGWTPRRHMLRWGPEPPPPPSSTATLGSRETRSRASSMGHAEAFGRGRHDGGHGGRRGKEATTAGGKGGGEGHDGTSYPWRHVWDRVAPVTYPLSPQFSPLPSTLPFFPLLSGGGHHLGDLTSSYSLSPLPSPVVTALGRKMRGAELHRTRQACCRTVMLRRLSDAGSGAAAGSSPRTSPGIRRRQHRQRVEVRGGG